VKILVLDNYDSFTFNLVQALQSLGAATDVVRNDALAVEEVERVPFDRLLISPGPKGPAEAGMSVDLVRRWAGRRPILGVCLGHQCIAAAFGASIVRARRPMHGKTSAVRHDGRGVFAGLPDPLTGMRYHSLVVEAATLPAELLVTARADGEVMGLRHVREAVEGVQFHPESYRTEAGLELLRNFVRI
jgi:anthranilate synthase/aminodeoxychorismate synthase-like glutamine amidotransferase